MDEAEMEVVDAAQLCTLAKKKAAKAAQLAVAPKKTARRDSSLRNDRLLRHKVGACPCSMLGILYFPVRSALAHAG